MVRGRSSLDAFARYLGSHVGAPVVNKTELPGIYEYEFVRSRAAGGGERAGAPVEGRPSPLRSVAEEPPTHLPSSRINSGFACRERQSELKSW